jgi:3-oxoacyl-[acyl-carrier protein] reductase
MNAMFKGKVVMITGGTRGIGRSIAEYFAKRQAIVHIIFSSDQKAADEMIADFDKSGYSIFLHKVGVENMEQVEKTIENIVKQETRIDILVNNAGIVRDQYLLMMSEENWRKVIDINLNGVFNCCKSVLPYMLDQRQGKIINISSTGGLMGKPGQTNYAASKAGIIGFTKALSHEMAPYNVQVNAVAPGFIATEMVEKMNVKMKNGFLQNIPAKKFGKVEDVANAVGFLASNAADYIIGTTLVVDGGLTS